MTPTDRQLSEAEGKLLLLFAEIRGTAVFARAQAYAGKFTGGRPLSEWLHDPAIPLKDRAALAQALVEILLAKQYDRLPAASEPEPLSNGASVANGAKLIRVEAVPPISREAGPRRARKPASASKDAAPGAPAADLPELVRQEVRCELAHVLEAIARALK